MNEAGLTDLGEAVETISSGIRAGGSETNGFIGKREAEPSFTVVHPKAATFIGVAPPTARWLVFCFAVQPICGCGAHR
jgi:hypothetical protein